MAFQESVCGYYNDRISRTHNIIDGEQKFSKKQISRLLQKGYRRYGRFYYRNYCRTCAECTPYRVIVDNFKPNRAMRRTLKRNSAFTLLWQIPKPTQEKYELYVRYQMGRHKDGAEDSVVLKGLLRDSMLTQMYTNPKDTIELVLHDKNRLVGFAIFDVLTDSLSAVYSVFQPTFKENSLGTFIILAAIEKTRDLRLKYLNLGLYLENHEKMRYKANFGPAEIYRSFQWRPFTLQK